jgi:hypothetical protein
MGMQKLGNGEIRLVVYQGKEDDGRREDDARGDQFVYQSIHSIVFGFD